MCDLDRSYWERVTSAEKAAAVAFESSRYWWAWTRHSASATGVRAATCYRRHNMPGAKQHAGDPRGVRVLARCPGIKGL